MTKDEEIAELKAINAALVQKHEALKKKVMLLLQLLEKQGVKKDSHNSHNSPSQDKSKPKRNRSLRQKSNRKSGGQTGHKGHTLKMTLTPDETITLKSNFCQSCGEDIQDSTHSLISQRQKIVLPPIRPLTIEYQQYGCWCNCGHHQKADYPVNITAPIQFGGEIIALVSYFNIFQYVPYKRLKLLFKDVFNLSMSQGSIDNLLNKAARKSNTVYNNILGNIKQASFVGSDETGAKVNGDKWWIWAWQTVEDTFLKASKSRGFDTIEDVFPEGLPDTIIGSDRWAAQLKIASKGKQLCFPHLLRDLNYLIEVEKTAWSTQFKNLLKQVLKLKQASVEKKVAFEKDDQQTAPLEAKLNELLAFPIVKEHFPLNFTFQKQMIKHRNYLFTCLYHLDVPADNNASERAVRNVKVKQKVSGQFKSGQHTFCVLRSVIDTLQKRELNVLDNLKTIMAT